MDETTKKQILGALIKKERLKRNYKQEKFSSLINIDPRNLSKIERGNNFPSFSTFLKIIEVLKIEPNYFVNFVDFNNVKRDEIDIELFEIIKSMSDETKVKLIDFLKTLNG